MTSAPLEPTSWRFSRAFWTANIVELLERAAWYGVFIAITLYLSRILAFNDLEAAVISGMFSAGLYLLPTFSGAYADRIGFKNALLLAFGLLCLGYGCMWVLPVAIEAGGLAIYGREVEFLGLKESWHKWLFIPVMLIVMVGGSFIKSVITGTVAKESTAANRARGYSIFYGMVNIGAFSGKTVVKPLRVSMGNRGLVVLNLFASGLSGLAFFLVLLFYRSRRERDEEVRSIQEIWRALIAVCKRGRLVVLIVIITGFWMVQHQLYATMPKYVLRMAGEGASPSWYANVNPAVVVVFVGLVTQLLRRHTALASMTLGMFIMPLAAFCMALGNMIGTEPLLGMHPVALMMVVGIGFQGLAECFISPRYLEYFSLQAPKGQEGLYLGFSHLHSFLSSVLGFSLSGVLLDRYCPAPDKFALASDWELAKQNAHYIWFVFVGIGLAAALALVVYGWVTRRMDARGGESATR